MFIKSRHELNSLKNSDREWQSKFVSTYWNVMYLKIDVREEEKRRSGTTQLEFGFLLRRKHQHFCYIFSQFLLPSTFFLWTAKLKINNCYFTSCLYKIECLQMFFFNTVTSTYFSTCHLSTTHFRKYWNIRIFKK